VPCHQETNSKRYDYFQDKAHPAKELSKKFKRVSAEVLPRASTIKTFQIRNEQIPQKAGVFVHASESD
jgi:hypothetical protein